MPFLELFALLMGNASRLEQSMPTSVEREVPIEKLQLAPDLDIEVLPFVIEGSVENFDPVEQAKELAKKLSRKWCGTYRSFNDGSKFDVTLLFSQVEFIGQIVDLRGEIFIDGLRAKVRGNLNAKSNQIELIVISDQLIVDIEPGSVFFGLEGMRSLVNKASRLNNLGGRLDMLNIDCD